MPFCTKVPFYRIGALGAQVEIPLCITGIVAMPIDGHHQVWIIVHDDHHFIQCFHAGRRERLTAITEEDLSGHIVHFVYKFFLDFRTTFV